MLLLLSWTSRSFVFLNFSVQTSLTIDSCRNIYVKMSIQNLYEKIILVWKNHTSMVISMWKKSIAGKQSKSETGGKKMKAFKVISLKYTEVPTCQSPDFSVKIYF